MSSALHRPSTVSGSSQAEQRSWPLLLILGLAFALSSGDRAILGVLKTTLAAELGFSQEDYARLVASLLAPYAVMLLLVGRLINRHGTRKILTVCLIVISLATAVAANARTFSHLAFSQATLGLAQAGVAPAIAYLIMRQLPPAIHATAYSTVNAIQSGATILCPGFVAAVTLAIGWRYSLLIPAILGFSVAAFWWRWSAQFAPTPTIEPSRQQPADWSVRALWRQPAVRRLLLARVISDPFWFFLQFWQVAFLREYVGLSLADIGRFAWIPPLAAVLAVVAAGWASDRLVKRGWPESQARLRPLIWITVLAPAAFALPFAHTAAPAIVLCALAYTMCAVWLSFSNVLMGTLAPGPQLAPALGLMSALGCGSAIVFSLFAGPLIERLGYPWPFWIGAGLHPLALAWLAGRSPRSESLVARLA